MHDEMRILLNAYLDGELHGRRLLEVQTHLASCADCREELRKLRSVSDFLKAAPEPGFIPTERFVSNLTLNLPRRSPAAQPSRPGSLAWWLVPAGLLFAWFFVQVLFTLNSVVSTASAADLIGPAFAWLSPAAEHSIWFSAATSFFNVQPGSIPQAVLSLLDQVSVYGSDLLERLFWPVMIVLAYWGWLIAWMRRGPRPMKMPGSRN